MDLLESVEEFICAHYETPADRRFLVAVSGGPDSMALVDILNRVGYTLGFQVAVAHVNYRIHRRADLAESIVRNWCERNGVPYVGMSVLDSGEIRKNRQGVEGGLRRVRYNFFADLAREGGYDGVCLAHHADDRAETVLLNLGRGTGLHGMAGISSVSEFDGTTLIRPLLGHRKSQLETYVDERELEVVDDPTNTSTEYTRNGIRHDVLPTWEQVQPNPSRAINRLSRQADRENDFWDRYVQNEIACRIWSSEIQVDRASFRGAHRAVQDRFIHWVPRQLTGHVTGWDHTNIRTLRELFNGRSGRRIDLPGPLRAVVEFDRVAIYHVDELEKHDFPFTPATQGQWTHQMGMGSIVVDRWEANRWEAKGDIDYRSRVDLGQTSIVRVRTWRPGDRIFCSGKWRSLKSLFQENRIPKRARHRWPVMEGKGGLLALPGLAVSDRGGCEAGCELVGFRPNHPAFAPLPEEWESNEIE